MAWSDINSATPQAAAEALRACCGSSRWVNEMIARRPFASLEHMIEVADQVWDSLAEQDYLEAFSHHPRIGEKALRDKFASTAAWASNEQSGVTSASDQTLSRLASLNDEYFNKFGFIFIVCATGKSAAEMLRILESRLPNNREREIKIAAEEQKKITQIRLRKL